GHFRGHARPGYHLQRDSHRARLLHPGHVFSAPAAAGAGPPGARCAHVHRPASDPEHARALGSLWLKAPAVLSAAAAHSAPLALLALPVESAPAEGRPIRVLADMMGQVALVGIITRCGPQPTPSRAQAAYEAQGGGTSASHARLP